MNALQIFRDQKLNYIEIGKLLGIHESEVERRIHRLRRIERLQPYLKVRADREAMRKADLLAAAAISSVPKPPRILLTEEQKAANRKAYRLRAKAQLREIRARHA